MDDARKKLRVCLICVVMAAVIIGFVYYFNDVRTRSAIDEGTLVRRYIPLHVSGITDEDC
ncbi:MAG: hypothetical protein HFG87_08305 [Dorea sp.]|nr:hypothetical protein [Dorea sp.]MCI9228181.1 hypothetical protein [Dorea sp.]